MLRPEPPHSLALVAACLSAGQTVLLALVPAVIASTSIGLTALGWLVALGTLTLMAAAPLWGAWSDRHGRARVLVPALAGHVLCQGVFVLGLALLATGHLGLAAGLVLLGAARIGYGFATAGVYPACQAWATDGCSDGATRLRRLSLVSAGANLGRGAGPLLVLPVLPLGALAPLAWLLALPVLALALVHRLAARAGTAPIAGGRQAGRGEPAPGPLWPLLATAAATSACLGQVQYLLGPMLAGATDLPTDSLTGLTAAVLAGATAAALVTQLAVAARGHAPARLFRAGAGLLLAGALLLQVASGPVGIAACACLMACAAALLVPAYTALGGGPSRRGRGMAWLATAHTAGYSLAFAVGGMLFEHIDSFPRAGVAGAAVAVPVLGLWARRAAGRAATAAVSGPATAYR